jgi:excisionase family DNA binding protein
VIPPEIRESVERALIELLEVRVALAQLCDAEANKSNGPGTVDAVRGLDTGGTAPMTIRSYGAPSRHSDDDRLINAREAAELVGVHRNTVYTAAKRGDLACIQIGRSKRFRRTDVLGWKRP